MTTEASPDLEKAEDIFKSLIWDNLVQSLLSALFAEVPWLAMPVVKQIISGLVKIYSNKLFVAIRLNLDLEAIQFKNAEHQKQFEAASVTLKTIASHQGVDSEAFKTARDNAKAALARFVSYGDAA